MIRPSFALVVSFVLLWSASPLFAASTPKVPTGARCLQKAYPKFVCAVSSNHVTLCDGTRITYDPYPGVRRGFAARLAGASLADQMSIPYPVGDVFRPPPAVNSDPGRLRHSTFFKKMYGDSSRAVRRTLRKVRWFRRRGPRRTLWATSVNGVDKKLQAISDALEKLPRRIRDIAAKSSGTFVWRKIRGTTRLSAHSFGIAIDVGVKHSNYWKWQRRKKGVPLKYRNRIPHEIVKIFERHGFIWGGKWYHYDTMHFEYRPELLDPRCRARRSAHGSPQAKP